MPRKAGGRNNPSHKRARKREREQMGLAMRELRFNTLAAQSGLVYEPHGPYAGLRARLDVYEWALRHAKRLGLEIPQALRMGSAMGWLHEHILGYEAGESVRVTKREEAEKRHENDLFEAAQKQLHQWIPQPVPDDFVCPYTGVAADKRKILATGVKYLRMDGANPSEQGSYVYAGHETFVVYHTGHRGKWYIAREIWDGALDSEGNRVGVIIEQVSFGEVTVHRQLGAPVPGLPFAGVKGHSGQSGRPILREQSDPRPDPLDPRRVIETKVGYDHELDARTQAVLYIISASIRGEKAQVMGLEHVDLRRSSRLRGGAPRPSHMLVSAPASETPGERHTATIPAHLWSGEIVEDRPPRRVKSRRKRKKPEDSEAIRNLIQNNRIRALS